MPSYGHEPINRLDQGQQRSIERLIEQRAAGTPIAYLIGRQSFWEHEFLVTPETLIPRPDTELLIETILAQSGEQAHRVIDLGTGSGAIAISLAKARPNWFVYATDRSAAAIAVARKKCPRHEQYHFCCCRLVECICKRHL